MSIMRVDRAAQTRMRLRAGATFAMLAQLGQMSDAMLLRFDRRQERQRYGRGIMRPIDLQNWSRQRRRARQTHPGKRGKR